MTDKMLSSAMATTDSEGSDVEDEVCRCTILLAIDCYTFRAADIGRSGFKH